ncbi:hypothetical protein TIFTF001_005751 [Ficus carica]|uniref:Uncharacterized protein n=1 Tax=Ficus carica TaxID=3494 RepID=A0AA88A8J5_FICCA|nr:hypothetical protein TIFTF001_005751 [Ficus carica]
MAANGDASTSNTIYKCIPWLNAAQKRSMAANGDSSSSNTFYKCISWLNGAQKRSMAANGDASTSNNIYKCITWLNGDQNSPYATNGDSSTLNIIYKCKTWLNGDQNRLMAANEDASTSNTIYKCITWLNGAQKRSMAANGDASTSNIIYKCKTWLIGYQNTSNIIYKCKTWLNGYQNRVTELEPEDEYPVEVVGLGQELTGRQADFQTWKYWVIHPTVCLHFPNLTRCRICLKGTGRRQNINDISKGEKGRRTSKRSYYYTADARWDGGIANKATNSSTWAPELRKAIFGHRSQARVRQKEQGSFDTQ